MERLTSFSITIIIPVYQVEPYIEACLMSVIRQTYKGSIECLLIDDCGTDDSITIAKKIIARYKGPIKFKILCHDRNMGLSAARNTGIEKASGEWIFFLDSDDEITDDCIEKMFLAVETHPDVEMVQGNVSTAPVINLHGLPIKVKNTVLRSNDEVRKSFFLQEQMYIQAWNKLLKRSFVNKYNIRFEEGIIFEDTPWQFLLLKHLKHVFFLQDVTYHYNRRTNSIVTGSCDRKKAENLNRIYHKILTNLTTGHEHEEVNYYGKKMAYFCAKYTNIHPAYKDDIWGWQAVAKRYGCYGVGLRLVLSKVLRNFRNGWLLLSLLYRMEHPKVFVGDFQRIYEVIRK